LIEFNINIADKSFIKRIKYVFSFIESHPFGKNKVRFSFLDAGNDSSISYGDHKKCNYHIPAQNIIFSHNPLPSDSLFANLYTSKELALYSVEKSQNNKKEFIINNQFSFDILEAIFFHISRYEEHIIRPDMKENWGMGSKENHFIPRNNLQETPIVDHLVFAFLDALGAQPAKPKTTYRLTHDVDNPHKIPSLYKLIKASGRLLLIERKGLKAQWSLFNTYQKIKLGKSKDPYDTFDWLFRKEKIEKVVYFMAGGVTKFDNFYKIDSLVAKKIIQQAKNKGYQFGIHPSYSAYNQEKLYSKEKKALEEVLGEKIVLARQHYLRFQFPETADIIDNQGIMEDSTLGYRDMIGFRCGTGFGYRLYNFSKEEAYNFVETPLIIMEWSLINQNNYDFEKIKNHLDSFLEKNKFYTKVTFLFHNSIFDMVGENNNSLKSIYKGLIKKIQSTTSK